LEKTPYPDTTQFVHSVFIGWSHEQGMIIAQRALPEIRSNTAVWSENLQGTDPWERHY